MPRTLVARVNRLLTWKRACFFAGLICTLFVVAYAFVLINGQPPLNSSGGPIVGDYIAFHTAGRLVLLGEGAQLYEHARIVATEDELLQGRIPDFYDAFRNPPFVGAMFAPLALLDLLAGFGVWTLISLGCLMAAIRLLLDELPDLARRWRGLLVLVFGFAPVYFGLIDGENATISLLLYVLIYRSLVRDQDARAGLFAALGLFKPQLFLVFPFVFLAQRNWRALFGYALTACGLAVISLAVVGVAGIQAWLRILLEHEAGNASANAWRMASLKSFFDTLLPNRATLALSFYVAAALLLVWGLVTVWSTRTASLQLTWVFTSLVAVLIDPHLVDYDLTVLVPAGAMAATSMPGVRWWIVALYPLLVLRVQIPSGDFSVQLSTLVLAICAVLVWNTVRPTVDRGVPGAMEFSPTG